MRLILRSFILCFLLPACSWLEPVEVDSGPRLGELKSAPLPDAEVELPSVSLNDIVQRYRLALEVADEPKIRREILTRLADLEMLQAEERQLNADASGHFFDDAISMYKTLLSQPRERTEGINYQLAKAYAMDGRLDESAQMLERLIAMDADPMILSEAYFRHAERAFSAADYTLAERGYASIVALGQDFPFFENAVYMRGWSQFKLGRYQTSLNTFTQVLDMMAAQAGSLNQVEGAKKNLMRDTLRVMALVFSYLDGPDTIQQTYLRLGERPYNDRLYVELGDLYLSKRRYRDSANTYRRYVEYFPESDVAPDFSVRMIDVYTKGNFPSLILPAKEAFVRAYGVHSHYWALKPEAVRVGLRAHLHEYIQQLAAYQHARAQSFKLVASSKRNKQKRQSKVDVKAEFLLAAKWYQAFLDTFSKDEDAASITFLMAESLFDAEQYDNAFVAYEKVAYHYRDKKNGAASAYATLLSATEQRDYLKKGRDELQQEGSKLSKKKLEDDASLAAQIERWSAKKITSAFAFAEHFPGDKRAPVALAQAAQELFSAGELKRSLDAAIRVANWQPGVRKDIKTMTLLLTGHLYFDLEDYVQAEQAYRKVLPSLIGTKQDAIVERIAASIYKRSEQLLANNKREAVAHLLRIQEVAPDSSISVTGQYDAAHHLMALEAWGEAERVLLDFRRRYPKHVLTEAIAAKLVLIYEQSKEWSKAASELSNIALNHVDAEVRRQSLYLAAVNYEKAEEWDAAIARFRTYAHTYAQPFDPLTEARFKMAQLYKKTEEPKKRMFWLRKLVAGHEQGPGTDRSLYLAALSATELAEKNYQEFLRLPLSLPLKASLKNKKRAFNKALSEQEKILSYGVADFSSQANYQIGNIYAQLSHALMDSQRPAGLDALALEQYDILLEEQAYPFEEQAIEVHEANTLLSRDGVYDHWVRSSFSALATLLPGRYNKVEMRAVVSEIIY